MPTLRLRVQFPSSTRHNLCNMPSSMVRGVVPASMLTRYTCPRSSMVEQWTSKIRYTKYMYSNEQMNSYMKNRYKQRRKLAIETLGGECANCGSRNDLDFHHIDPQTKEFTIARGSSFSDERFWEEVHKCELLCNTCHVAHHQGEHPHGDVKRYWRGCRCQLCKSANTEHNRAYKLRRKEHLDSDV